MSDSPESNGYDAMALAVKASIEELLIPFHVASDSPEFLRDISTDEFFRKFLVYADKFTGRCCQELSKIFRMVSIVPEVRGTPTLELGKQIRHTVFEGPDRTLVSYVDTLRQINIDLGGVTQTLSDSSVLAEAMKGAAIGRVAGGFGDTGKVLGAVGAIAAAGKEAAKQQALLAQQQKLMDESRNLAFSKIIEYLKEVEALPENLLDYGCAKCFGGKIDFSRQALAVASVGDSIRANMEHALALTLSLQRIQREQAAKIQEEATAKAAQESEKAEKATNKGCGGCLVVVGVIMLIGTIGAISESGSEDDTIYGIVISVGLIAGGIYLFVKRKKQKN
jgi:hypothetical protein